MRQREEYTYTTDTEKFTLITKPQYNELAKLGNALTSYSFVSFMLFHVNLKCWRRLGTAKVQQICFFEGSFLTEVDIYLVFSFVKMFERHPYLLISNHSTVVYFFIIKTRCRSELINFKC